jgi:uncharacterized repeat protein (TIGR03803 family)
LVSFRVCLSAHPSNLKKELIMKTEFKHLLMELACTGLLAMSANAQTFTTLYSFTAYPSGYNTNSDGASPNALILSGDTLYGTAENGGTYGYGTVFAVNINSMDFTNLYSFTNGTDGASPYAGLILSGDTLYGTAAGGGSSGNGTLFRVNTNGMGFTNLYSFTNGTDGVDPIAGLILSGNTLYGTAYEGGADGYGTVFRVNTNGMDFTTLHSFGGGSDGGHPVAGLILSGNTLYGTTPIGGSSGNGTVFAVNTNGMGFTNLYSFTALIDTALFDQTNSDGANPQAGLILSGNTLYGTASDGGTYGAGTVFAVNTNGTGFTTLHIFAPSEGANLEAGLILSGNTLYGTASEGGTYGYGTVFAVNTNGTGFTTLYSFVNGTDGAEPEAGLILSGKTLYGTAEDGGSSGNGTLFSLVLPPLLLTIIPYGDNVILAWPTNAAGFTLQSTTNLGSPAGWSTNSSEPVVVIDGQNVVVNPITGKQMFFRLANP